MPRESRAVVFDLDDTLYPSRQFQRSGFAAVARHLEHVYGADARATLATLLRARRGPERGRELQTCLTRHALPERLVRELLEIYRHHVPTLSLPPSSSEALAALRRDGWRLGILTNGDQATQQRKIAALGLTPTVDAIVYATEWHPRGKPEPEGFHEVAWRLDVPRHRVVFVGNDEECDVAGAFRAGMRAVLCTSWVPQTQPTVAHRVVTHLPEVPAVAAALIEGATSHAA